MVSLLIIALSFTLVPLIVKKKGALLVDLPWKSIRSPFPVL
jgi:hypothetical protein